MNKGLLAVFPIQQKYDKIKPSKMLEGSAL